MDVRELMHKPQQLVIVEDAGVLDAQVEASLSLPRSEALSSLEERIKSLKKQTVQGLGQEVTLLAAAYHQGSLHPLKEVETVYKSLRSAEQKYAALQRGAQSETADNAVRTAVGIANVSTMVQLHGARSLGADFVMLSLTDPSLIKEASRLSLPVFAAVGTVSEIAAARELGADFAAVLPADGLTSAALNLMQRMHPNFPLTAVFADVNVCERLRPELNGLSTALWQVM